MKLSAEVLQAIQDAAADIRYGSITIKIVETSPDVDLIIESRHRLPSYANSGCSDTPAPGKPVRIVRRNG